MPAWWERFISVLSGSADATANDRLLLAALIGCSLFTLGQLLTMLGTRWGDHHAMAKSFFVSVLIHLCLGLGWATAVKSLPPPPVFTVSTEEQPIPIRDVILTSEEELSQPDPGNTPLWRQPAELPDPELLRSERDFVAANDHDADMPRDPLEVPSAPPEEVAAVSTTAPEPEPADLPELTPPTSAPPPTFTAAEALATPEALARPDVGPVAARPQADSRPLLGESASDSPPVRGSALRTSPEVQPESLSIPLPEADASAIPNPQGAPAELIVRRASPLATPIGEPIPGATSPPSAGALQGSRFARSSTTRSNPGVAETEALPVDTVRAPSALSRERIASARQSLSEPLEADALPVFIRPAPSNRPATAPATAATTYKLRRLDRRKDIALQNGGTEASELAVEMALAWLARHQEAEGYWDADKHGGGQREVRRIDANKPPGGRETDTGLTGLAILSFLGAGHTHEEGDYTREVALALRWLIAMQRSDGYLGGRATYYDQMYCHAIAAYALAEAYGMQSDPSKYPALREAVEQAVWYICQTQNKDGGWRYRAGFDESDMSMFGWQLMALKSAQLAGLEVPEETRRGMIQFLRQRSRGTHGGLAGYKEADPPSPAMTAEALFCKQMYGLKRASAVSREAVDYLLGHLPKMSSPDEYYWYYGTLAMFQYGGEPWQRWNDALRDTLIRLQRKNGDAAGSWDPVGPWGPVGGRIYSTTFCVLSLEVYYRFLPLYQVGED
jgi:hypothetical protein